MENTVVRILRDVSVDGFTELLCSFLYNYKCAPTRVYLFLVLVSFRCAHWVGGVGQFQTDSSVVSTCAESFVDGDCGHKDR